MLGISHDFLPNSSSSSLASPILLDDQRGLAIGELTRYIVIVDLSELVYNEKINELFISLKNVESSLLRFLYLTGPYSLYVDIRPYNYSTIKQYQGKDLQFIPDMKPDEIFEGELKLNEGSRVGKTETYIWIIDVLSQMTVMTDHAVRYRICVGYSMKDVRTAMSKQAQQVVPTKGFRVDIFDTEQLWNEPPLYPNKPIHVVFLTHGIFSNVGCDMLYLSERLKDICDNIEERSNPNIIVRGYSGNSGRTHRGIRYLGLRLAEYIISTIDDLKRKYKVEKVSFIGHSLGGLIQASALYYIVIRRPELLDVGAGGIQPFNFIALASPFLGVIGDFPIYATLALEIGALGKTGRDLNLKSDEKPWRFGHKKDTERLAILEQIPTGPAHKLFCSFVNRTLYANGLHDGIVPLRTSALLYLDWYGLRAVNWIENSTKKDDESLDEEMNRVASRTSSEAVEIPEESPWNKSSEKLCWAGNMHRKSKFKWYKRSQILIPGRETNNWNDEDFHPPTKSSAIMSAANIFVAPLPTQEYIKNPNSRSDFILHDKVYSPEELPPPYYKDRGLIKKIIYPNDKIHRIQERIARAWQEEMTWRKVIVNLERESHNNIIVRRRFVNSFGWVVVEHLIEQHFCCSKNI